MRLIDADTFLMDSIKEKQFFIYREDALNDIFVVNTVYGDLKKALANTPTIDAVEVVRCKDCKHREIFFNDPTQMFCHKWLRTMETDLNFFCAYGAKMAAEVQDVPQD